MPTEGHSSLVASKLLLGPMVWHLNTVVTFKTQCSHRHMAWCMVHGDSTRLATLDWSDTSHDLESTRRAIVTVTSLVNSHSLLTTLYTTLLPIVGRWYARVYISRQAWVTLLIDISPSRRRCLFKPPPGLCSTWTETANREWDACNNNNMLDH